MFFAFLDWMYIFLHVIITEHALSVDLLTDKILYICIEKKNYGKYCINSYIHCMMFTYLDQYATSSSTMDGVIFKSLSEFL